MMASSIRTSVLLLGLGLVAASAAAGCDQGSTSTTGGGGSGGSGSSTSSTSSTGGSAPVTWDTACNTCLKDRCKAELDACDADCIALQGCLDTVCGNLSAIGSSTEGQCQAQCQSKFPNAKNAHIDVVNCAQGAIGTGPDDTCMPPCAFASFDWEECVKAQAVTTCKPARDACNGSADCQTYEACVGACTTNTECQACAQATGGQQGRELSQTYWTCVAKTCLAEAWLPHF